MPKRHTSEPPRLVSSPNVAVPRVIVMFASVCVIFINRLTHRPSPCISVSRGPECLLSTFPWAGGSQAPERQAADPPPIPRSEQGQRGSPRLVSQSGDRPGGPDPIPAPACLTAGAPPTQRKQGPPAPRRLFPSLFALGYNE